MRHYYTPSSKTLYKEAMEYVSRHNSQIGPEFEAIIKGLVDFMVNCGCCDRPD